MDHPADVHPSGIHPADVHPADVHLVEQSPGADPRYAISWESHAWVSSKSQVQSRRQRAQPTTYQAAVPARIAGNNVRLETEVLAEAEDAIREITRFDAEVSEVVKRRLGASQQETELAPLAAVLLSTESSSSSEIEGVSADAKALALANIQQASGPEAQLIAANVKAMKRAIALSDEITVAALLDAHEALMEGHVYADPGRLRSEQVWIGTSSSSPVDAAFVPPHHNRVPDALEDLIHFIARADLPVLPQVAIAHAQFETIHPFNDGNGRTGRALVHAMLRHTGVTRRLTVPVSAGLLTDTGAYFSALTAYRAGYLGPIVTQFTHASFRAINNGRQLVGDLQELYGRWDDALPSRQGSAARRLLPHLLSQPAVNVRFVQASLGVSLYAAQRAIEQLAAASVLTQVGEVRRNRVWVANEVLAALDDFAARAGRRTFA